MLIKPLFKFGLTGTLGGVVGIALLLGSNLWTYSRLTHETWIGDIQFSRLEHQYYQAEFVDNAGQRQTFTLQGDQWQLDTQVIKWNDWVFLLGKDTLYRLDRISGRYADPDQARTELPSLVDLRPNTWLDLWSLARAHPDALFMVDASYGSSVYQPMRDGVTYRISLSPTGLLVRPTTEEKQ